MPAWITDKDNDVLFSIMVLTLHEKFRNLRDRHHAASVMLLTRWLNLFPSLSLSFTSCVSIINKPGEVLIDWNHPRNNRQSSEEIKKDWERSHWHTMATSFFVWSSWDLSAEKSQSLVKRVVQLCRIKVQEIRFLLSSGYWNTKTKKREEIFRQNTSTFVWVFFALHRLNHSFHIMLDLRRRIVER